jgi:type IV pilus assembly protein PilV
MTHFRLHNRRASKGFTLVEILVALVVLSIGLLGVAALQLMSLRSNHASALRSQATFLAYDIVDRMRANCDAALNGNYDIAYGTTPSGAGVANTDLAAWRANVASTLPAFDNAGTVEPAKGEIVRNGDVFTIRIRWSDWDDSGANSRTGIEFSMDTQLVR